MNIHKLSAKRLHIPERGEKSYLIICGDFGGVWHDDGEERYWLNWLDKKNFVTLFIDGNHENHERLNREFPAISFYGGRAHRIRNNIYHLMRGQVFFIQNKKIFTMGGAASHDKEYRTEGRNWWKEELPNQREYQNAIDQLSQCNWKVDYAVTHCAPQSIQEKYFAEYDGNDLTLFLEKLSQKMKFEKWYFGHYHVDKKIDKNFECLFDSIKLIGAE